MEVGCGTGVYIKHACDRNSELTVLGLELQKEVADFDRENTIKWGLEKRVSIENRDVRHYNTQTPFDIITFFNLIYYFPENERIDVLKRMKGALNKGGQLILTTLCQTNDPSIQIMNLWVSMTNGCGSLPNPNEVRDQLMEAGLDDIRIEKLLQLVITPSHFLSHIPDI